MSIGQTWKKQQQGNSLIQSLNHNNCDLGGLGSQTHQPLGSTINISEFTSKDT